MSDVAKYYIDETISEKYNSLFLVVFFDPNIFTPFDHDRILFIADNNLRLFKNAYSKKHDEIEGFILKNRIDSIVVDYYTYDHFRNIDVKLIGDVHYLIKPSHSFETPKHEIYENEISKNIEIFMNVEKLKKERQERRFITACEKIIVNSNYTLDLLQQYYATEIKQKTIEVINVSPVVGRNHEVIKTDSQDIIYHGRFNMVKRIDHLIELGKIIDQKIHLYGASPEMKEILDKKKYKNIVIHNWVTDIDSTLLMHNVHIFPSMYEPWGLALTKSMAMGAICIANSNAGGHRLQIKDKEDGFLVDFTHDLKAIKDILDHGQFDNISLKARTKAQKFLSTDYLKEILRFIND